MIAKVFDIADPTDEDRVAHEFELIRGLDVEGVVRPQELRRVGDQLIMLLEYVPGVSLAEHAGGRALELTEFWSIATQLTEILARVHAARVIHRDIKPTNVLIGRDNGRVCLVDFGISVLLEHDRRHIYDSDVFVGTLPYISPEQTGRTGHAVDFRSDLYSLGVTFYQLLTGRLPFEGLAPLELIHAHLAREPEPPRSLRSDLPEPLSRLVMKLLTKAPEHRYQTASGLAADLIELRELHAGERPDDGERFVLGTEDLATSLRLPHQLYGRTRERAALDEAFATVARTGERRTFAVLGPVGVGKSSLVHELEAAVAGRGGYMLEGKFDVDRDQPYAAFAQAFTRLFEQLLTESDARLIRWRRQLLDGLGNLASVVAELCPTFELVVGPQSTPAQLDAAESRNRLQLTIERLLAVICTDSRPAVLALDDIHWAGPESVGLLEAIVHGEHGPLLVLVTLRREAIGPDHPVRGLAAEVESHPRVGVLELGGLPRAAIEQLIADSLPGTTDVGPLAEVVARKTSGVPLFVRQFLSGLAEREILRPSGRGWVWELERVESEPIPDDAVEVMSAKIGALRDQARDLLTRAACLGPRFDLDGLLMVGELTRGRAMAAVIELEQVGLLARVGTGYRFTHDAIRTAARQLLDPVLRRRLHWTVGRQLLVGLAHSDEQLYEIVDHLAAGLPEDADTELRLELAQLELRAGERSLESGAWDLGQRYLGEGIRLTSELHEEVGRAGASASGYELVVQLHARHALALALAGRRARADRAFAELLEWKLDDRDYAEVVTRRVRVLWTEGRHAEALELGSEALARLEFPIPRAPDHDEVHAQLTGAWQGIAGLDLAALTALPACTDERDAAIIELVAQLKYPAYSDNQLYLLLVGLHVRLSLERGYHPSTPLAIGEFGVGVSGVLGQVGDAVRLLDLAVELATRAPTLSTKARVVGLNGGLSLHRGRAFAEVVELLDATYYEALELGEFDPAGFLGGFGVDQRLEIGTHLHVLERRAQRVTRDLGRWCPKQMRALLWLLRAACGVLLGDERELGEGAVWDLDPERVFEHDGVQSNYYAAHVHAGLVALVLGEHERALDLCTRRIADLDRVVFNTWYIARATVVLCVASCAGRLAGAEPVAATEAIIDARLATLARWAEGAPDNYGHYLDLAEAMRAAVDGQTEVAARGLDRAWKRARLRGCRWVEGIAAEQLAALLEREGLDSLVHGARARAFDAYAAWGAAAKLERMRRNYPDQLGEVGGRRDASASSTPDDRSPRSGSTPPVDLAEVLRRVGTITEDLRLEQVIERVLDATLTSVGADRGLLALEQAGELALVAVVSTVGERRLFDDPPLIRDAIELAPTALINFVSRTGQAIVLDDARADLRFAADVYLEQAEIRSVLAMPLRKGERRLGVLVLENRLTTHGFAPTSVEALRLITGQAASTLENAQLYAALRRSEARWRSLVDGAPDLIALLDEHGRVVFRNHEQPLLGLDEIDRGAAEGGLDPSSLARWRETVADVLRHGERSELELQYVPRDGPARWYAVRLAPIDVHRGIRDDSEVVHRNAVVVATDITARREAELEMQELEAQLRQQQRLESIGTLASGVAHEINNPIQGIMNYAELIRSNPGDTPLVEEFAGEIGLESDRVATIVRNLLAFSRQDAPDQSERIDLGMVVETSLSLIRTVLRGDHIEVEVRVEPGLPAVRCRVQQIQQVVMNLVANARDALNERYGEYDERKRVAIDVGHADRAGWVRVAVRDTGPGIPAHVLARIFDPFFTTKGRDQGTGLGLSVSHGIVQDHGGELDVQTELGVGTCFSLELPAVGGLSPA